MDYSIVVVSFVAFFASGLTLFSGFGLGTILMPVMAIFFPLEIAIGLTAVVHFLNNLFKLILLGKKSDKIVVMRFGLPAIAASFVGAGILLLLLLQNVEPVFEYSMGERAFFVFPVKLIIAIIMIAFVFFESLPRFKNVTFPPRYLMLGGLLSGFFGGLSGHQGALRSAFLIKCGLSKESFIATGVVIACLVDFSRMIVYGQTFQNAHWQDYKTVLMAAIFSAFFGAYIGNRLIKKITVSFIQILVSILLLIIAILLGLGII